MIHIKSKTLRFSTAFFCFKGTGTGRLYCVLFPYVTLTWLYQLLWTENKKWKKISFLKYETKLAGEQTKCQRCTKNTRYLLMIAIPYYSLLWLLFPTKILILKQIPKVKRESYYYLLCLTKAVVCEMCKELIRNKWGSDTTFLFFYYSLPSSLMNYIWVVPGPTNIQTHCSVTR